MWMPLTSTGQHFESTAKWALTTGWLAGYVVVGWLRVGEFMASFVLVAIFSSDLLSPWAPPPARG